MEGNQVPNICPLIDCQYPCKYLSKEPATINPEGKIMCVGCKYNHNGACEFLLLPESCDQFDLGDKFEQEQDKTPAFGKPSTPAQPCAQNKQGPSRK